MCGNLAVAFLASLIGFAPIGAFGDILLVEVAALFIIAGLFDLGSSIGTTQFKKVVLSSKEEFSPGKRDKAEQHTIVLFIAGSILFVGTILLALFDLFLR
jgi:hypothetical protein